MHILIADALSHENYEEIDQLKYLYTYSVQNILIAKINASNRRSREVIRTFWMTYQWSIFNCISYVYCLL